MEHYKTIVVDCKAISIDPNLTGRDSLIFLHVVKLHTHTPLYVQKKAQSEVSEPTKFTNK